MIAYRAKLAEYLRKQKLISDNFFSAAAAAEEACDLATHSEITKNEQNAAQAMFKTQFRDASRVRTEALRALGPPPVMPHEYESNGNSHETHNIESYGGEQELSVA